MWKGSIMVPILVDVRRYVPRGLAQQGELFCQTGVLAYFTGRVRRDNATSGVCNHLCIPADVLPFGENLVGEHFLDR